MKLFFLFIFLNLIYQTSHVLYLTSPLLSEIVFFHCIPGVIWTSLSMCQKKKTAYFDGVYKIFFHLGHSDERTKLTLYTYQDICSLT